MFTVNKPVSALQGISLVLTHEPNGVFGAVSLYASQQLFKGRLAEALRQAQQLSVAEGFGGYYEIDGIDELIALHPTDLGGVLVEINRQLDDLRDKGGMRNGFGAPMTQDELIAMVPAQQHVSRLLTLRDAITRRLSFDQVA